MQRDATVEARALRCTSPEIHVQCWARRQFHSGFAVVCLGGRGLLSLWVFTAVPW